MQGVPEALFGLVSLVLLRSVVVSISLSTIVGLVHQPSYRKGSWVPVPPRIHFQHHSQHISDWALLKGPKWVNVPVVQHMQCMFQLGWLLGHIMVLRCMYLLILQYQELLVGLLCIDKSTPMGVWSFLVPPRLVLQIFQHCCIDWVVSIPNLRICPIPLFLGAYVRWA